MDEINVQPLIDYDIVFIGPLAAVVANLYRNRIPQSNAYSSKRSIPDNSDNRTNSRLLVISNKKTMNCPVLLPTHQSRIQLQKDLSHFLDHDTSQIYRIMPNEQIIIMKEKKYYHYRYLVYGQSEEQWMDLEMIENLSEALNTNYSYVYSNLIKCQLKISEPKRILRKGKQWIRQFENQLNSMMKKRKSIQIQIENHKKYQKMHRFSNIILPQTFTEQLHHNIESTTNLLREQFINIIFYVPKDHHSGFDNYNILYKYHEFVDYYRGVLKEKEIKQKQFKNYLSKMKETEAMLLKVSDREAEKSKEQELKNPLQILFKNNQIQEGSAHKKSPRKPSIFTDIKNLGDQKEDEGNIFEGKHIHESDFSPQEEQELKEQFINSKKLNFMVILEGQSFYPYDSEADQFFKKELLLNDIQVMINKKITKIDYLRRVIHIKGRTIKDQSSWDNDLQEQVADQIQYQVKSNHTSSKMSSQTKQESLSFNYDYLFTSLKQRTPLLLINSKIDPYNNSAKYLYNNQYKNVYIFGADLFPTTHTFEAVNYQAHVICANLMHFISEGRQNYFCHKKQSPNKGSSNPLIEYNGYTGFPIWVDNEKFIKFSHQYFEREEINQNLMPKTYKEKGHKFSKFAVNQQEAKKRIVQNSKQIKGCCEKCWQHVKRKWFMRKQLEMYYNLNSYGMPYYFFAPELSGDSEYHCFVKNK